LTAACSLGAFIGAQGTPDILPGAAMNTLCLLATLGFGTSLLLIHIYVSEIKGSIQARPPSPCPDYNIKRVVGMLLFLRSQLLIPAQENLQNAVAACVSATV
jgi:hypothetical protein